MGLTYPTTRASSINWATVVGLYVDSRAHVIVLSVEESGSDVFKDAVHFNSRRPRMEQKRSCGALDEEAMGRWRMSGDQLSLTSDPLTAPRYVVLSQKNGPEGVLRIIMDFKDPYYQQHFFALITQSDGSVENVQLGIDGLTWAFPSGAPPKSVRLLFNVYQFISDPLPLAASPGYLIHYRFEANDLGKVEFKDEPVKILHGELLLERHGRTLRFKRVKS